MSDGREGRSGEEVLGREGPPIVTFVDRAISFPPLKLEVEESAAETNASNMWQVYALGGFMIMRWIWARWRERKDKRGSVGGSTSP